MTPEQKVIYEAKLNLEDQLDNYEKLLRNKQDVNEQQLSYLLQLSLDLDEEELATRAYLLFSLYYLTYKLDHLKALDFAKLGLEQSEDLPNFYWRIKSLIAAANAYHILRDYPNELNLLQQSLRLLESNMCTSIEYYPLHHAANYSLGVMYSQMGLYTIARPFIETAFSYCRSINDRHLFFKTKLTLANMSMYEKDFTPAMQSYQELYEEYGDLKDTEQWAILNNYIGILYIRQNDLNQAESYLLEAVRIRKHLGDELRLNYSYFTMAKILYLKGKYEEGDKLFAEIEKVMEKYPHVYDNQIRNDILYELFAAKGNYEKAYHHFKELDISFVNNSILEKTIGSIFENERVKQKSIQEDTDHFRRLNDEMQQQAIELQKMNKDLNNYARTASHDLREPLRMVYTYMTILETKLKEKLTEEEKTFMRFAVDGSKRMDEMITRILNTAKGAQSSLKPVDLNQTVIQIKANLQKLIQEKNAVLHFDNLPIILADDIQMLQVLQNLTTNAIKYNKSTQPTVLFSSENKGDAVVVSIADNGVGIPEEAREKVFEMFSRVQNESGEEGTGIGLSTVKSIIEKMRGKIWIESNHPEGSVFKIYLPTK